MRVSEHPREFSVTGQVHTHTAHNYICCLYFVFSRSMPIIERDKIDGELIEILRVAWLSVELQNEMQKRKQQKIGNEFE